MSPAVQLVGAGPPAPEAAVVHAPLSVLPAPFPAASFAKAAEAAPAFNSLIAAVAADSAYLQETLAPAAEFDDFTARCHDDFFPRNYIHSAGSTASPGIYRKHTLRPCNAKQLCAGHSTEAPCFIAISGKGAADPAHPRACPMRRQLQRNR